MDEASADGAMRNEDTPPVNPPADVHQAELPNPTESDENDVETATPDITHAQLVSLRAALRERLQNDFVNDFQFMSNDESVNTLFSLFERTIESGQNQSGLLLGSTGFGHKQIVARTLRRLRDRFGTFTHVYLNGTILQNEVEAFKEIIAQLGRDKSLKHPVLSYPTMYSYLRQLLRDRAEANEPVLLILDGFEQFASKHTEKQLLLYNLLDWLQFKDVKMGVLGISTNFSIVDAMEKRVRSRFSRLQVVIPVGNFNHMRLMLHQAFTARFLNWRRSPDYTAPSTAFLEAFDSHVDGLLGESAKASSLLGTLEGMWDKSRSPEYFIRLAVAAAGFLTIEQPFMMAQNFHRALYQLEPDYQLATLQTITNTGIALLIGMSHLEGDGHTYFTLEMVYRRWQDFYRKHDMLQQLPTRTEAQLELENLIQLKLVEDAGDPFRISRAKYAPSETLQPEYRAVHLCFEPKTLQGMIRSGSIQCSTAMSEWMVNGG
ncbi:hypothetical protein Poli38472_011394 [Pythium oligandrum]|uniref:Origin recognition complex subunit 4 C-terminal domain-containing protein n=1 Tax=Pythium oligandrum TaxID=41045 RepID=A0A8K1FKT0_PYTOL|nr:hypothetical protein Poli38472_011394 [Pythium oligandrum]|eukprot:TMW64514.1 hypothetical protein Poli38472_011394 [Pythium oligandrum]